MRLFLTYLLPFHWMAVFALLAVLAASGAGGTGYVLEILGATVAPDENAGFGAVVSTVFATGFALVAVLFFWSLVTSAIGGDDFPGPVADVSSLAFGTAIGAMTTLFLVAAIHPVTGLFQAVAFQIAALAASYVAVHCERRASSLTVVVEGEDVRAAARLMAAGAAHSSMLTRLSGRGPERGGAA